MHRVARALLPILLLAACGRDRDVAAAPSARDSASLSEDPRYVYGATAEQNIRVVPVDLDVRDLPGGWSGMRIAAISDFQLGLWPDNQAVAEAAVRRAIEARPDVVVLLGDYVARGGNYGALDQVLAPLRGRTVLAVLGDHDEIDRPEGEDTLRLRVTQALERNGVTVLRNSRAMFVRNGDTAYIAGLEPFLARRPDWQKADVLGGMPGGEQTPLLLTHMPVTAVSLPTDRFPALIAGHSFCGTVEVPETPRLAWFNTQILTGTPNPNQTRIYRLRGTTVFITCGVGYSFVPVRYGSPPEVALITLRGFGVARADSARAAAVTQAGTDSLIDVYRGQDSLSRNAQPDSTEVVEP
jgi:predicted MPP superfamily phosphohydrolase